MPAQETMTLAEYRTLTGKKKPKQRKQKVAPVQVVVPAQETPEQLTPLEKRLKPLMPKDWLAREYRTLSLDPRSPENTAITTAKMNAVIVWPTEGRPYKAHLGWIWDVQTMSNEQIVELLKMIEKGAA